MIQKFKQHYALKSDSLGVPIAAQQVKNLTSIHEVASSIP